MKNFLDVAAVIEAATGLALMIYPLLLSNLLLGEDVSGAGMALGRVAGFALLGLGLACWRGPEAVAADNQGRSSAAVARGYQEAPDAGEGEGRLIQLFITNGKGEHVYQHF
jgi:hypothetical protein